MPGSCILLSRPLVEVTSDRPFSDGWAGQRREWGWPEVGVLNGEGAWNNPTRFGGCPISGWKSPQFYF